MTDKELILTAINAMKKAYAPYSSFMVGAALLTKDGKVYTGCNIENAAYGPTNCAERTAIFKAVSEGERSFKKIAVIGGLKGEVTHYAYPCGVCRQVMSEFCGPDFEVIVAINENKSKTYTLSELIPCGFGKDNIG